MCAIASSLKVTDALTALQAAAPGGFANASQAQLAAALKSEKKKAAEKEELEEQGKCLEKSKGRGTRGRAPAGTAGPTAPVLALAMALAHALKDASEQVPKECNSAGVNGAKKKRIKKGMGQGQKAGSEDQMAGVESASVFAAAQGEPGEAAKLQMDLTAATCEEDAAAGKPAKDVTKEPAIEGSPQGAKRKLGTAREDDANLSVEGFAAQRSDLLPPPVGAKSSAILAARCAVEPPAATAAALVQTTSCSDAASEAHESCCCVICCFVCVAF